MRYLLLSLILLIGCAGNLNQKKTERVSQAVYATHESLEKSRIDLAKKYSDETIRLVAPPKKRLPISSITFTKIDPETRVEVKESIIVLPEASTGRSIRLNSEEFFELLKQKEIANAYEQGEKNWQKYSEQVTIQIEKEKQAKEKLAAELAKEKNKKIGIFTIIQYGVMGLLAIPVLIVIAIVSWLVSIIVRVFQKKV
jgi:hypothetical protein